MSGVCVYMGLVLIPSPHAECFVARHTSPSVVVHIHLVSRAWCVAMGLVLIPSPHAECFVARHTSPSVVVHIHLVSGTVRGYGSCAYPITRQPVVICLLGRFSALC